MKIILRILLLLVFNQCIKSTSFAQLIKNKHNPPAEKQWKFILSFDGRRSFVAEQSVKIGGIRIGFQYLYNFRTGIGLYGFDKPIVNPTQFRLSNGEMVVAFERLTYPYITLFFEPIIYKVRKWEFSLPTSIGRGVAVLATFDSNRVELAKRTGGTRFFESAMYAENRVFWWAGIGGGIGYRKVLNTQIIEGRKLNGMYYQLAIKIYLGEIVRRTFKGKGK